MQAERSRILGELRRFHGGLVVSCQARAGNPLHGPATMAMMARAAELGGARGVRVDGAADLVASRGVTALPIIAGNRVSGETGRVTVTPTVASAWQLLDAGARFVALDASPRRRPANETLGEIVAAVHAAGAAALGDLDGIDDLPHAVAADIDAVGTALAGSSGDGPAPDEPDFALLEGLVRDSPVPVYAAGRYWTPEQVRHALSLGAWFVVVGAAVTNPMAITSRFVRAIEQADPGER